MLMLMDALCLLWQDHSDDEVRAILRRINLGSKFVDSGKGLRSEIEESCVWCLSPPLLSSLSRGLSLCCVVAVVFLHRR